MTFLKLNNKLIKLSSNYLITPNNPIYDGNTVGWYDSTDLTTITKDGSDFVSLWKDKLNSGHDLIQNNTVNQPKWFNNDGILFDGINDYLATPTFSWGQPEMIYIVFKSVTWKYAGFVFDGYTLDMGELVQFPTTQKYSLFAGGTSPDITLIDDTYGIMRVLFNGINSKFILNNNTPIIGNFGINSMNGFTLGINGAKLSENSSNIQVKEIVLRNVADTPTNESIIYNYLKTKYSL